MINNWQDVWVRLAARQDCLVLGDVGFSLPDPADLGVVVIDCDFFPGVRGSLEEMHRQVGEQVGGESRPLLESVTDKLNLAVRRHLLGSLSEDSMLAADVTAVRSLGPIGQPTPTALVFRGVDWADARSLRTLAHLLRIPAATRAPFLFTFQRGKPHGPALELLEAFEREVGVEGTGSLREDSIPTETDPDSEVFPLAGLSPITRQVLRACVVVGERFESEIVTQLLDLDEATVLGCLQEAADAGLPLNDRGNGRFRLPAPVVRSLRADTLPSLVQHWHTRLADLFGGGPCENAQRRAAPIESSEVLPSVTPSPSPPANDSPQVRTDHGEMFQPPPQTEHRSSDPREETWWQRLQELEPEPESPPDEPAEADERSTVFSPNASRAAGHAEAAGRWPVACGQHLAAATRATGAHEHGAALVHAERALELARSLPAGEERRLLEVRSLLSLGRARFFTFGQNYPLASAAEALERARTLLEANDPPTLHREVGAVLSTVLYELGTEGALSKALEVLQSTSRILLEKKLPLEAARLLNDEAAVLVKLGDPVRANYLLTQSREVFRRVAGSHPAAPRELAETDHLLARLILQSKPRPGRERDAALMGVEYARSAEEAYRSLSDPHKLARVQDTLGRLYQQLGRSESAEALLSEALSFQRQAEDSVGQARTSAGLSDVLFSQGKAADALEQLSESAQLNIAKGAVRGMKLNLQSLMRRQAEFPEGLRRSAAQLAQHLERAIVNYSEDGACSSVQSGTVLGEN